MTMKAFTSRALTAMPYRTVQLGFVFVILLAAAACGDESVAHDSKHIEFFETKIRPLLVNRCYECHSGKSQALKAGLRLDSKAAMLKGGDTGPAIYGLGARPPRVRQGQGWTRW